MTLLRPLLIVAALSSAAACASDQLRGTLDGDDGGWPPEGDTDDSDGFLDESDYWSVDGELELADGQPLAFSSELHVRWRSARHEAENEEEEGDEALCATTIPLVDATETPVPAGIDLYGWWSLVLGDPDVSCPREVPRNLRLGIGALDVRLAPAMDARGYALEDSALYGLYLQIGEAPVVIFGVAGTDENFAGETQPVPTGPLPDGSYLLVGLHLLPLPG